MFVKNSRVLPRCLDFPLGFAREATSRIPKLGMGSTVTVGATPKGGPQPKVVPTQSFGKLTTGWRFRLAPDSGCTVTRLQIAMSPHQPKERAQFLSSLG
jgi:hypothetical protein